MQDLPDQLLGDPLPSEPLEIAEVWLNEAWGQRHVPNPNAMILASVSPEGRPSARVVLCKQVVATPGYIVFYTNYRSRKGLELAANPHAAAVLHFDHLHRQVRIEGVVQEAPADDSDAYFASRALESQVGAWASAQSHPIASRAALLEQVAAATRRFPTGQVPRPGHWGGYRLWAEAVELWVQGPARIHDRARWTRALAQRSGGFEPGPWSVTRLQP
jgi:pyridoxamine 5'-phosphate oxidase